MRMLLCSLLGCDQVVIRMLGLLLGCCWDVVVVLLRMLLWVCEVFLGSCGGVVILVVGLLVFAVVHDAAAAQALKP